MKRYEAFTLRPGSESAKKRQLKFKLSFINRQINDLYIYCNLYRIS